MVYPSDITPNNGSKPFWKKASLFILTLTLTLALGSGVRVQAAPGDDGVAQAKVTKPEPPKTVARTYNGQAPIPEIKQAIDAFFNGIITDDIAKAMDAYLQGTPMASREDAVHQLVEETQHAFALYGKMVTFEPVDTYAVGNHVIVTTYLTILPKNPLRWRFVYYKSDTSWHLLNLRVDDDISDIVEQ